MHRHTLENERRSNLMNHTCSGCGQCDIHSVLIRVSDPKHTIGTNDNGHFGASKCQLRMPQPVLQPLHNRYATPFCFQFWNHYTFQKWPFLLNTRISQVQVQLDLFLLLQAEKNLCLLKQRKIPVPTSAS